MSHATDLATFGVAVVPILDETEKALTSKQMWEAIDTFPEYKMQGRFVQRVLGGFGALGNPSSFHHPVVQELRVKVKHCLEENLFRPYCQQLSVENDLGELRLEALFDRICIRHPRFGDVTPEAWHRDAYDDNLSPELRPLPESLQGAPGKSLKDCIFGGWLNLNTGAQEYQYLACILGSHTTKSTSVGGGFCAIPKSEHASLNSQLAEQAMSSYSQFLQTNSKGYVMVPPGHAIVFLQGLVHMVAASTGKKRGLEDVDNEGPSPDLRLFIAHRLTTDVSPLFRNLDETVEENRVPFLPSGQIPPMYSKNHYRFFSDPKARRFRTWGQETFQEWALCRRETARFREVYYTPGSPLGCNQPCNRGRWMPSLKELRVPVYMYSAAAAEALTPTLLF